jgi:hypothetical protein
MLNEAQGFNEGNVSVTTERYQQYDGNNLFYDNKPEKQAGVCVRIKKL